jgi:hypothetical protein
MRGSVYVLMVCLVVTMVASGCRPAATDVGTPTAVATERPEATATPEPTATPEATEVAPTEEPIPTDTPVPTEPEPSATATPEPETPTATAELEEPTATPEPTAEPAEPEGRVVLEERCTACHGLGRVESARKSREEWVTTVERMVGYGAQLSEDEESVLIDYLAETYGP